MTNMKSSLRLLIGATFIAGTALLAGCGDSGQASRTTTTEQSSSTVPMAPMTTTTTTDTQRSQP